MDWRDKNLQHPRRWPTTRERTLKARGNFWFAVDFRGVIPGGFILGDSLRDGYQREAQGLCFLMR
jgi:hypothetical protein